MQAWKTRDRCTRLHHGKYLTVEMHTVELPDGQVIAEWPWLVMPDYVNVLAVTESGKFLCFRQTKYALQGTSLAPVGGYVDPGEEPRQSAERELLEETGYEASEWVELGSYPVDGNRGGGVAHLYLALRASPVREPNSDDLEDQQLLLLRREEVERALRDGQFKVLGWAAAVGLALLHLDRSSP